MAQARMTNSVSMQNPRMVRDRTMTTLTEVLRSDAMRRLLNRQNVRLQDSVDVAEPSMSLEVSSTEAKTQRKPELSVIPIMSLTGGASSIVNDDDERHLLPSKSEGKSSIALLPLRRERKACGHYEPCESLVCDVTIQRHREAGSIRPLIAVNISDNEIDAPVSKHCDSDLCDALSVDHNRCRRAIVRCHRCDLSNACDVCLTVLKTRKSQMNHKNCKMRIEYRHNRASRGKLLRDRMRQRELEIIENARTSKKADYDDPVDGHERAIECLQKNTELIVIPRASLPVQQHPTIRITSVTGAALTTNRSASDSWDRLGRASRVSAATSAATPARRAASPERARAAIESSPSESTSSITCNPLITITPMSANNYTRPVTISNFLQSQQARDEAHAPNNSFIVPIRMVPIASLKTEPSLMHRNQGVPKFCLVAEAPKRRASVKAPKKILPARATTASDSSNRAVAEVDEAIFGSIATDARGDGTKRKSHARRARRKRNGTVRDAKSYECSYCFKKFTTDWYFKMHIAKHKGEIKYTCKFCKKPFMHLYNMTKHIVTMHKKDKSECASVDETNENIEVDKRSLNCANCKKSFATRNDMENHPCRVICLLCHCRVLHGDLLLHLKAKHVMSDEKAVEEYDRQRHQKAIARNRLRIKRSLEADLLRRGGSNETKAPDSERELGASKRKRNASIEARKRSDTREERSLVRRLTRRRNNVDGPDAAIASKTASVYLPEKVEAYEDEVTMAPLSPEVDPLNTQTSR